MEKLDNEDSVDPDAGDVGDRRGGIGDCSDDVGDCGGDIGDCGGDVGDCRDGLSSTEWLMMLYVHISQSQQ